METAYETAKSKGGPLDSDIRWGKSRCRMFWTHDPDGTSLEIMELTPESLQCQANKRFEKAEKPITIIGSILCALASLGLVFTAVMHWSRVLMFRPYTGTAHFLDGFKSLVGAGDHAPAVGPDIPRR